MEGGFRVLETAAAQPEDGQQQQGPSLQLQATQLQQATRRGRVVYPLFSKEIQRVGRAHKAQCRAEYLQLKEELKEAKRRYKSTRLEADKQAVDALYQRLDSLQEKRLRSKKEFRELRRTVRAECRILRKRNVSDWEKTLIESSGNEDTWKTRLPHMQKLFLSYDEVTRTSDAEFMESVITNGSLSDHQALEMIQARIDAAMTEATVQPHVVNIALMDAIVYGLSRPAVFLQFMQRLLKAQSFLDRVVSESYHHDLFDKTVLLSGAKSGWKLRMHVFLPATFSTAQEEVHSHRNHFVSHILHGGFRQEIWEEPRHCNPAEEKEFEVVPFYKYIYDPTQMEDGTRVFNISPLGKIDLARVDQVSLGKGGAYYMHPSVLHSVNAIDGCTVTLVLNSPQATLKSCFASLTPWKEESFVRERFTLEQVQSTLAMVAGLLNN